MAPVRVSAISYLNTVPLIRGLLREPPPNLEVSFTVPSHCADLLRSGEADVGLIPAIEYQRIPGLVVLGDAAIATRRGVRSILLLAGKPLREVRTVAADTSSRTSVALVEVLFRMRLGRAVKMIASLPDPPAMLRECDAALVIGDPALRYALEPIQGVTAHDLAADWNFLTRKSFVFAFWAARREAATAELVEVFQRSREEGLAQMDQIVKEESESRRLPAELVRSYLTDNIHFVLDAGCLDGLAEFYRLAHQFGITESSKELEFVRTGAAATC